MKTRWIDTKNLDVWVLAGQSNMQGCGLLSEALPPDERVLSFSSAGHWEFAEEPLHRFWESITPVHQNLLRQNLHEAKKNLSDAELAKIEDETRFSGAGLALSYGKTMSDITEKKTGLIPCAHGGTSLEQWSPELKNEGTKSLYGAMLERIRLAGGKLRGILWFQGESDARRIETASSYGAQMKKWIEAVRADLKNPELKILLVQIGKYKIPVSPEEAEGWNIVRRELLEIPNKTQGTAVTTAIDLGMTDTVHIDSTGLIRLGRRLAKLAANPSASPRVERIEAFPAHNGLGALRVVCSNVKTFWLPDDNIMGFEVCNEKGERHPDFFIINAFPDHKKPTDIIILINLPADKTVHLAYGVGCNPYCNAVDCADMPLCAFPPRKIN